MNLSCIFFLVFAYQIMCRIFALSVVGLIVGEIFFLVFSGSHVSFSLSISRRLVFTYKYPPLRFWQSSTKIQFISHQHQLLLWIALWTFSRYLDQIKKKISMRRKLDSLIRKFQSGTFLVSHRQLIWLIQKRKNLECSEKIIKN